MSFTGTFALARMSDLIDDCACVAAVSEGALRVDWFGEWQSCLFEDLEVWETRVEVLADLVRESGAPALVGLVLDGDCLWVHGMVAPQRQFEICVARTATADHLQDEDLSLDQVFLDPVAAVAAAIAWSEQARVRPDPALLEELLGSEELPVATNAAVWTTLLHSLGLRGG